MKNNNLSKIHDVAMEFVEEARIALVKGDIKTAKLFFEKAYNFEKEFALAIPSDKKYNLTRSVFLRSAATLALDCGKGNEAIELAEMGLQDAHSAIEPEFLEIIQKAKIFQKSHSKNTFKVEGKLVSADIPNSHIKIQESKSNKFYLILIPQEEISTIVRKYWEDQIFIKGKTNEDGIIVLEEIRKAA